MDLIKISLNGLSADTFEFDLPPETSVKHLKTKIAGNLGVPPFFQNLILGTIVLCDTDTIAKHCPPNVKSLCVSILLTTDQAMNRLVPARRGFDKIEALRALEALGLQAGEYATTVVISCVRSPYRDDASVRFSAVRALAAISQKGNKHAIDALCSRLGDPDENVRQAIVEALKQLVESGDKDASAKIADMLSHASGQARLAALSVLGDIVEESDEQVIIAMSACLDDLYCEVRMAAARALLRFIDCPHVSSDVRDCLRDSTKTMLAIPASTDVDHDGILYTYSD
jgi:HEAT repeat protein